MASANRETFAVKHDNVPSAKFVAVIAVLTLACGGAKIIKVGRSANGMELVIANGGPGTSFQAAPRLVIALEILFGSVRVSQIADGHDGSRDLLEEFRGSFGAGEFAAIGDVAGTDQRCDVQCGVIRRKALCKVIGAAHLQRAERQTDCN